MYANVAGTSKKVGVFGISYIGYAGELPSSCVSNQGVLLWTSTDELQWAT